MAFVFFHSRLARSGRVPKRVKNCPDLGENWSLNSGVSLFTEFGFASNCGGYSSMIAHLLATPFRFPSTWVYEGKLGHLPEYGVPAELSSDRKIIGLSG